METPRSLQAAKAEYADVIATAQDIDAQLTALGKTDPEWRRRAITKKRFVLERSRFLKSWIKDKNKEIAATASQIGDRPEDDLSDPVVLVAHLRRAVLAAYRRHNQLPPLNLGHVLDAATVLLQREAEAIVNFDLDHTSY